MDPTLIAEQPTGFVAWIMANGQIIAFFAQLIYWMGMLVLLGYAVWQYKKWVNFQLGIGKSGQLRADHAPSTEEQCAVATDAEKSGAAKPSVDEFVE